MSKGRSVRLYLVEGSATGILTAEIINWTGHVLAGPRTRLEFALRRDELVRTGVYILYGGGLETDLPSVYVGEGDSIASRIRAHSQDDEKDYWDRFVAFTSKDLNLTKAHVRYLEGRLICLLRQAKKCNLKNRTEPTFERLPEADISDMEAFLEEIQLVLPVIGVDFLRRPLTALDEKIGAEATPRLPVFYLHHTGKGISARAVEAEGEFVVLSGATGSLNRSSSFSESIRLIRDQALESGRATPISEANFLINEDIAFSSPSAASVFLFGTSRNGRTDWLVEGTGETYSAFKGRQI